MQIINFVYFAQRTGEKNMVFFSDQKWIAKGETKSYKRWKIALCHTEKRAVHRGGPACPLEGRCDDCLDGRSGKAGGRDFW